MEHSQYQRPPSTLVDEFSPVEIPPSPQEATPKPADMARIEALLTQQNMWLERIAWMIRAERADRPISRVKIEDANMPFLNMVGLMVKGTIAAIPAGIIAGVFIGLVVFVCGGTTLFTLLAAIFHR